MEAWIFLSGEPNIFSPLRQFAQVYSMKKQCTWLNVLSFNQIIRWLGIIFLQKIKVLKSSGTPLHIQSTQVMPAFMVRFMLKKWFIKKPGYNKVIVFTDNPRYHILIDGSCTNCIWVYIRPACPNCAQHIDNFFHTNDMKMVSKASLVVNDSQLNAMDNTPAGLTDNIFTMPTPPLIPDDINLYKAKEHIAGFYGAMDKQIDIDLIFQSAMALPGWTFELHITYGKVPEALQALPNVKIKKAEPDPEFFSYWDLALLPYSRSSHHYCHNPPMLIDYIRYGLPVASTALPVMDYFAPFVTLQQPKETFAKTLRQTMNCSVKKPVTNIKFDQWWEKVAEQLCRKIEMKL